MRSARRKSGAVARSLTVRFRTLRSSPFDFRYGPDCGFSRFRSDCWNLPLALDRRRADVHVHLDPATSSRTRPAAIRQWPDSGVCLGLLAPLRPLRSRSRRLPGEPIKELQPSDHLGVVVLDPRQMHFLRRPESAFVEGPLRLLDRGQGNRRHLHHLAPLPAGCRYEGPTGPTILSISSRMA